MIKSLKHESFSQCDRNFREKFKEYVISECENPLKSESMDYKKFAGDNYVWVGSIHYKGLAIFAKEDIKLKKPVGIKWNFKNFIFLNVNDSFNLLCVWAMSPYVEMIHDYFDVKKII